MKNYSTYALALIASMLLVPAICAHTWWDMAWANIKKDSSVFASSMRHMFLLNCKAISQVTRACGCSKPRPNLMQAASSSAVVSSTNRLQSIGTMRVDGHSITMAIEAGDITRAPVKVIVSPVLPSLQAASPIARHILSTAGQALADHLHAVPHDNGLRCEPGKALIMPSFALTQRGIEAIIYAVAPDCTQEAQRSDRHQLLSQMYTQCLDLARIAGHRSIAFPMMTGSEHALREATATALDALYTWVKLHPDALETIRFVLDDKDPQVERNARIYLAEVERIMQQSSRP